MLEKLKEALENEGYATVSITTQEDGTKVLKETLVAADDDNSEVTLTITLTKDGTVFGSIESADEDTEDGLFEFKTDENDEEVQDAEVAVIMSQIGFFI